MGPLDLADLHGRCDRNQSLCNETTDSSPLCGGCRALCCFKVHLHVEKRETIVLKEGGTER
jgi:hypothetical protein